jgi:hypothetical protein
LSLRYRQQEVAKGVSQVPEETPSLELNQWKIYKPLRMSNHNDNLTILQYNVNHSSNKIQTPFLQQLDPKEHDIIAIQEPWINP